MAEINCIEKNDIAPVCPHCSVNLGEVWCRKISAFFGVRYIYFCPQCKKVLGVSHRKGNFMG